MSTQSFADLGVSDAVVPRPRGPRHHRPFAIQSLVIGDVLAGRDVLAKSPTGSGKTLAFADPARRPDRRRRPPRPSALILAPTRELASQIVEESRPVAHARALKIAAVYGGVGIAKAGARGREGAHPRGHARAGSRTCSSGGRSRSRTSGSSCSTRPTACSTWASGPPWTGSSPGARPSARRCSSPPRSRARPAASRVSTRATRCGTSTRPPGQREAAIEHRFVAVEHADRVDALVARAARATASWRWCSCAPSAARTGW